MKDDDIVQLDDLSTVRAITRRTSLRVIGVSVLTGALGGGLFGAMVYAFRGPELLWLAYACVAVFTGLGLLEAIKWCRHYRIIGQQLSALEIRVRNGETIYGSQVKFQSYR